MNLGSRKKSSKRDNDFLDDVLGDLLSEDSPAQKRGPSYSPSKQKPSLGNAGRIGEKDDQFYSALAAMADSDASDVSEADVGKMANSLGGLDDMDADLFGDNFNPKSTSGRSRKPTTPRQSSTRSKSGSKSPKRMPSPSRSDTPTSPPGSARSGSLKRKPVKPPSPSTTPALPSVTPDLKPSTAPGKMNDLSEASENLRPGQASSQRPETAPKVKKKYEFGDFDPDDPLAGVLSDDDLDDILESARPKSATRPTQQSKPAEEIVRIDNKNMALESPRRRNLMERPPTRSGSNAGDNNGVLMESPNKNAGLKPQTSVFSEDDGEFLDGLGLEGKGDIPATKKIEAAKATNAGDNDDNRPARSVFDNLLGRSNTAAQHLQPKEKKEFVLDSKYSSSFGGSGDGKDGEDDFNFGNYQPSAASGSRPNSRRSVRFQDDDDIFGMDTKPSPRVKSPGSKGRPAPAEMEWLEIATDKPPVTTSTPINSQAGSVNGSLASGSPQRNTSLGKPPTPSKQEQPAKSPESPKKLSAAGSSKNISPRAWLGLDDSESDGEELFKPKKSSARSAALPQSQHVSMPSSPKVVPKKPGKKEVPFSSPKLTSKANEGIGEEEQEEDDWLARAKSRRQQMLKKGESKDELGREGSDLMKDSGRDSERTLISGRFETGMEKIDSQSLRVDLSSIMESPKPASGEDQTGLYGYQDKGFSGRLSLDTPLVTPASEHMRGHSAVPVGLQTNSPFVDPHLKSPASAMSSNMIGQSAHQLSTQQQQYVQIQEHKKSQLLQQQNQLKNMLENIENQYDSINMAAVSPASAIPSFSHVTSTLEIPNSSPEAQIKLKKLELEKQYLEALLESSKRRFEEEMLAVETSYRNRLQIVEDSNRKKESRLREENEELMQQHISRVRFQEQEKSDLINANFRKLEDFEVAKSKEIESVKEQHRINISTLKREHEEAMERLAATKNQEINMVANAHSTSKNLTAVVEQIQTNARDLGELQLKVDTWNRQGLDEREISLKSKDEQLRILQERLNRQEDDNERERKRLEELIARMESQLRDQTRCLEEERWKLKQDQSRIEAQQRSLEEERRLWLEQQARERVTMERTRENLLDEQRTSMAQISEERRSLVEERSKFSVEQKTVREKLQQDSMKHSQAGADYEILMHTITEEKSQHAIRMQDLKREETIISSERNKLERDGQALDQEREKLAEQARQIRQQSTQIDHMTEAASRARQEGEQALEEALHMNSMMEKREQEVHKQQQGFKVMEEHISQEKLRLAKEKKEVENLKSASLCTNCRGPLHGGASRQVVNGFHPMQSTPIASGKATIYQPHIMASSVPVQASSNPLEVIASSIASDRAVRMMKIQALKDKEFLDAETIYLESLRHTPYHSVKSNT